MIEVTVVLSDEDIDELREWAAAIRVKHATAPMADIVRGAAMSAVDARRERLARLRTAEVAQ